MNTAIKCLCGIEYKNIDFKKHFKKCKIFTKYFKEFDLKISILLKNYANNKENLLIIKFLFKRYIKLINNELKKFKNNDNNIDKDINKDNLNTDKNHNKVYNHLNNNLDNNNQNYINNKNEKKEEAKSEKDKEKDKENDEENDDNNNDYDYDSDFDNDYNINGYINNYSKINYCEIYNRRKYMEDNFKEKYKYIIDKMKNLFYYEIKEIEVIEIILNILSEPNLTIFEAMNLIYRETQIIKTLNYNNLNKPKLLGPENDIFEDKNISYSNKENIKRVIMNYKIYRKNNNLEKNWLYIDYSDKRRKLLKYENGIYNYIPLINLDNSLFSKNENELLFHPLYYKTLLCKYCDLSNEKNEENIFCPYAHNILNDFRIIYDNKDENINKFMLLLLNSKLFKFKNYLNYIKMSLSSEFNIDTFKVHKCQNEKKCLNNYHLCPYYHKKEGDKQRRPPLLFGYSSNTGKKCFINEKYCPKECDLGIFCPYLHSKNEYNYHPENFRKKFKCVREKVNGKCIYYKTCYGIHEEKEENINKNYENEKEENILNDEDIIDIEENDDNIKEIKNEISDCIIMANNLRCRKCQIVSNIQKYAFLLNVNIFLCLKCFFKK